ncbi:site-specific integrase [Maribellus sp. CM-23]|uniref:site-specific integrase n=1 Tax=Maribellus sp. CM-23 TaxID=2781026 RepID=UPI001F429A8C|nr:site-specific integrase [Maribellus sp. CM-23]MCE4565203.1 site-specific integrase [Maribellus sp. CM-23]
MNASISVVCFKSKTLANGENPLMLQVNKNGKRKYKSLGISVNQNHWDFKKNRPKPTCPDGEYIQQIILNKVTELQKQVLNYGADNQNFTLNKLLNGSSNQVKEVKVGEFFNKLISEFGSSGKVGNRRVYKDALNTVKAFSKGNLNFTFADIDVNWLNRFENWMRANKNKETSMSLRLRTLRSAYNKAIEEKAAYKINYPFNEFKISKFNTKTSKRAITKAEIQKIIKVNLSKEKESVQLARDIFIFSYLCSGINFTDIANLQPDNISGNQMQYIRQKTGKKINVLLIPDTIKIIEKYSIATPQTGHIFPILDKRIHKTAQQKRNRIHKVLGRTGKGLKRIAELCKITTNLSTYVARHSFATVLKNSGVSIALISEALGHSALSTTQIYLDSFENKQFNEAMKHLI